MLGLAQAEDDDDDSHLCIKCSATIIGLDNYVQHRKSLCSKNKISLPVSLNVSPESLKTDNAQSISNEVAYRENHQGADVFFQSLELQSSAKRPPATATTIPTGGKTNAGVLTRRATAAMLSTGKDIHNYSEASASIVSQKRGEDWIGGQNLRVTGTEDNQTKLIKAIANICETVKKEPTARPFSLIDYKHDDDSNEESEESDEIDDEDNIQTDVKWKPPASHTGGKWKPLFSNRDSSNHWPPTSAITPEPDHTDDWEDEHTGGKWKPFSSEPLTRLDKIQEMDEDEDDVYMPPPGHTKGKWIPGAKDGIKLVDHKAQIMDATAIHQKEGRSVQYWCGPCNRRLGSLLVYEKHLLSNFHLKRTLPEKDLEYSGAMKLNSNISLTGKRTKKPSIYLNDSIFLQTKKKTTKKEEAVIAQSIVKKRRRRPTLSTCIICKYRVKPFLMGKHLISHYHFRKAAPNDEVNKTQILDNIHRIVLQSPFQCSPCKFYTNWQSIFLQHWRSQEHKNVTDNLNGRFWCSFCKFEIADSQLFHEHLIGRDHLEVVAAINRSMPIIIRKKSVISCGICNKEFKFNIQLKRHIKLFCRGNSSSTASDEYQGKKKCSQCSFICKSRIGLSRHMKLRHGRKVFFCSACSAEFTNVIEARTHRRSQSHRIKEKELRVEKGLEAKDITKACPHCDAPRFKNIIELKKHLQEKHSDATCSCPQCGMKFTLPQEVTWHIRHRACAFASGLTPYSNTQMWNCRICPFETSSHAECIFHEVLHGNPVGKFEKNENGDMSNAKYSCPVCHKLFMKHSLRCHLRQHTNERPHACAVCGATFSRKSNLIFHIKRTHSTPQIPEPIPEEVTNEETDKTQKSFPCLVCGVSFSKKYNLKQHATRHSGRPWPCPAAECTYTARSPSELRVHQTTHSVARPYRCTECQYAAKTKSQLARHCKTHSLREKNVQCPHCPFKTEQRARLERHLRLHSGSKPFACRYCTYTCNNLENLRKHVLSRNKHKNKFLYECEHCVMPELYSSNFAKEFSTHLSSAHPALYPDNKLTNIYVANYLKIEEEITIGGTIDNNADQPNPPTVRYNPVYGLGSGDVEKMDNMDVELDNADQVNVSGVLDFPTEGCYSVTESGVLVPYENF